MPPEAEAPLRVDDVRKLRVCASLLTNFRASSTFGIARGLSWRLVDLSWAARGLLVDLLWTTCGTAVRQSRRCVDLESCRCGGGRTGWSQRLRLLPRGWSGCPAAGRGRSSPSYRAPMRLRRTSVRHCPVPPPLRPPCHHPSSVLWSPARGRQFRPLWGG